jgi:hypothetical protein
MRRSAPPAQPPTRKTCPPRWRRSSMMAALERETPRRGVSPQWPVVPRRPPFAVAAQRPQLATVAYDPWGVPQVGMIAPFGSARGCMLRARGGFNPAIRLRGGRSSRRVRSIISDTAGNRVGGMFRRAEALGYAYEGHLRGRTSPRRRASSGGARDFSRWAGGVPAFASSIISMRIVIWCCSLLHRGGVLPDHAHFLRPNLLYVRIVRSSTSQRTLSSKVLVLIRHPRFNAHHRRMIPFWITSHSVD